MSLIDAAQSRMSAAFQKTLKPPEPRKGQLGYRVGGEYQIVVSGQSELYYVRFPNGSFIKAYHRNRVQPIPDLPVLVGPDARGLTVILDLDYERIRQFGGDDYAGNLGVGLHTHELGSGLEFPVSPLMITGLAGYPSGGMNITIEEGLYYHNGSIKHFGSTTFSHSGHTPATVGNRRWSIIGINPVTETEVTVDGPEVSSVSELSMSLIEGISGFIENGYKPIIAVETEFGQTNMTIFDLLDLRFISNGASSPIISVSDTITTVDPITSIVFDPEFFQVTDGGNEDALVTLISFNVDEILTDANGNILVDANGNVLLGG